MFKKPVGYDEATTGGGFVQLDTGGHYLMIKAVNQTTSRGGLAMLEIMYDTVSPDKQPGFFANDWQGRKDRDGAKWQGRSFIVLPDNYQPTDDRYKWSTQSLKSFITSVERSNNFFTFDWNPISLHGKKVGGCFGEEEYLNQDGEVRTSVRHRWWCSWDEVPKQQIPKVKELPASQKPVAPPPDTSSELPFEL